MRATMSDGGDDLEWVCYPCSEVIPGREGRVTVHGDTDPDRLSVWCPWCGDAMELMDSETGQEADDDA
jgi:RNase P subunit RPR2